MNTVISSTFLQYPHKFMRGATVIIASPLKGNINCCHIPYVSTTNHSTERQVGLDRYGLDGVKLQLLQTRVRERIRPVMAFQPVSTWWRFNSVRGENG